MTKVTDEKMFKIAQDLNGEDLTGANLRRAIL